MLSPVDLKILRLVQADGRMSLAELGDRVGLSTSAVNARLARLRRDGVIRETVCLVDPAAVGLGLAAFVQVTIDRPDHEAAFLKLVNRLDEIQECHHVTGRVSYFLKIRTTDTAGLEELLKKLKSLPGLVRTESQVVLSSPKQTTALPIGSDEP